MKEKKFYITTPIYYVNDVPHIGHAYTTIAADALARYHRLIGDKVFFLTGTDEHGQKVQKAAEAIGLSPKEQADKMVENFKALWKRLNISNDAFIRTTDTGHISIVQQVLKKLHEKGEIVLRNYTGWYCTPDERFWTEKEIIDGKCPDCGRPVEHISEDNYFFLMSKYQDELIKYIKEDNPAYIMPGTRRNEVLGFLENHTLGDLCISRPKSRLSWGIPLPFDENYVTYVWFDALLNYYSATKYLAPKLTVDGSPLTVHEENWWPPDHHLVGKDILTTHSVYWSSMLKALGLALPRNIFAHGWWTLDKKKMSKSLGNVIDPNDVINEFGADALRYFLLREVPFGVDGDFSREALINRINSDLANDLGNLVSRFLTMAEKYFDGIIYTDIFIPPARNEKEAFVHFVAVVFDDAKKYWGNLSFNQILEYIWMFINEQNIFIAKSEPWKIAKSDPEVLKVVLFKIWNALRLIPVSLYPFMPETAMKIWKQLGLERDDKSLKEEISEHWVKATRDGTEGTFFDFKWKPQHEIKVTKGSPLFPRIEKPGIK